MSTRQVRASSDFEVLVRQRQEQRSLGLEVLGHREASGLDVAEVVPLVAFGHHTAQHLHGGHPRDRDHVTPPKPPDLAFDAALLVGALDAGQTEEGLEAVVTAHGDETVGLDPTPALHHPDDGGLEIVIADAPGHPAEVGEGGHMSVEEHLLGLVQIHPVESLATGRQPHHEHPALDQLPVQEEADLAEVDLGLLAEGVVLGHADIGQGQGLALLHRPHVAPDGGFAHLGVMLLHQALEHPSGRVPLLLRHVRIGGQPAVDGRLPGAECRGRSGDRFPGRWNCRLQRLAHHPPVHAEPA